MDVARTFGAALRGVRAGFSTLTEAASWLAGVPERIAVTSEAFGHGTDIPRRCTIDGAGISPPLHWTGVPDGTRSLVLLVEDPDIPLPTSLVHLLIHAIPPGLSGLPEGAVPGALRTPGPEGWRVGRNSFGRPGWIPPSPPPGHGPHHYCFQLLALDDAPTFEWTPGRDFLLRAVRGHVLARGSLVGVYER